MVEIFCNDRFYDYLDTDQLRMFCEQAGYLSNLPVSSQFTIVFIDDKEMQRLNHTYRNKDQTTDVLSFCLAKSDDIPSMDEDSNYIGEIYISFSQVILNAFYFKVTIENELKRVVVHGMLHLLGYDHATNDMHEPMISLQERLLEELCDSPIVPNDLRFD
jgi:probable rRNA maturation factor